MPQSTPRQSSSRSPKKNPNRNTKPRHRKNLERETANSPPGPRNKALDIGEQRINRLIANETHTETNDNLFRKRHCRLRDPIPKTIRCHAYSRPRKESKPPP